jgi:hypothetical protein
MDRPKPHDLAVLHVPGTPWLRLWVATEQARRWVLREAPEFGTLYPPVLSDDPTEQFFRLEVSVSAGYDVGEVTAYLLSYNDNPQRTPLSNEQRIADAVWSGDAE